MAPPRALPFVALALAVAVPSGVQAQDRGTGIQRCERPDGTRVYTDQDCAVFSAAPAPVEGELLVRLASDGGDEASTTPTGAPLASTPAREAPAGRRPTPATTDSGGHRSAGGPPGCARSPTQLVMDLRAAWQQDDVNRLAASYHWAGSGTREATSVMSRLQSLLAVPLQDIRHYGAGGPVQLAGTGGLAGAARLHVALGGDGRARVRDLRVVQHQGCYFVRF